MCIYIHINHLKISFQVPQLKVDRSHLFGDLPSLLPLEVIVHKSERLVPKGREACDADVGQPHHRRQLGLALQEKG